ECDRKRDLPHAPAASRQRVPRAAVRDGELQTPPLDLGAKHHDRVESANPVSAAEAVGVDLTPAPLRNVGSGLPGVERHVAILALLAPGGLGGLPPAVGCFDRYAGRGRRVLVAGGAELPLRVDLAIDEAMGAAGIGIAVRA